MAVHRHLLAAEIPAVDDQLDLIAVAVCPYGHLLALMAVKVPVRKNVEHRLRCPP